MASLRNRGEPGVAFAAGLVVVTLLSASGAAEKPDAPKWTVAYKGPMSGRRRYRGYDAPKELAGYMSKVLGREVAVVPWEKAEGDNLMLVTDASHAPADIGKALAGKRRDAFVIRYPYEIDGRKVCLLAAHDGLGYDFPVYYFLREFMGVHWVGPGELGEVIPENPAWTLPESINVLENPDFEHRLWADVKFKMARPLLAGSSRMGFHHALGIIFHPTKHGDKPEVYPLIEGKRYIPPVDHVATAGWQPCVGSPKSLEIAVQHVLDAYAKHPQTVSVSLSVNDGAGNHCECKLCRAMDAKDAFADPLSPNLSDRYFRFYNKVIEQVLKQQPEAYVAVLGYGPCSRPPVETKIHDRVIVFVTGGDPTRFAGAGGACSVYHYHLDNAFPTIRHYPHLLAEYVRTVKGLGGMGYYSQIEHSWAAGGPKTYVLAHLLWDVDSDVDALLDEYMNLAFGPYARAAMQAYFDRWEQIFEREERPSRFNTISAWNIDHLRKFRTIRWDDLHFLDAALKIAKMSSMTPKQRRRLDCFETYYRWTRAGLAQYLMAHDLHLDGWLATRTRADVLLRVEDALALTKEYDRLWDTAIAPDRTGWLLNPKQFKYVSKNRRFYDSLQVGPIRTAVEAYLDEGIEKAFAFLSTQQMRTQSKEDTVASWQKASRDRPALRAYIQPEIDRLKGVVRPNLLANGGFEKGVPGKPEPGQPPTLPGWWFYDRVGMVLGAKARYEWSDKDSRDGSKCLGFGEGKYPGIRGFVKLQPGRYRFAFWYRTHNRKRPVAVNILKMVQALDAGKLVSAEIVREVSAKNDNFIKFLQNIYPPTNGEWRQVSTFFEVKDERTFCVMIEPFFMEKGAWAWFDDVVLRRVW